MTGQRILKIPRSLCWLQGDMGSPLIEYLAWWNRRQSWGENIGQRHLVSSAKRYVLE